ncbi:hypothetical protein BVC80_8533g4 [Macleaya cordata]|uniref:Uncharacterized protein n=1 Tax=Macleaya cordata TaxID=56857 RepID=A0A200PMH1_MACCD|nr:hypothetical protein BVC80_8533g4 [Macleaya cordata]
MGSLKSDTKYESLRVARISENQARLASLGLEKSVSDLRTIISTRTPSKTPKKCCKKVYSLTSLRRSNRLNGIDIIHQSLPYLRRSRRLNRKPRENPASSPQVLVFRNRLEGNCSPQMLWIGVAIAKAEEVYTTLFLGFVAISADKRNCAKKKIASIAEVLIMISHVLGRQIVRSASLVTVCFVEPVSGFDMVKFTVP